MKSPGGSSDFQTSHWKEHLVHRGRRGGRKSQEPKCKQAQGQRQGQRPAQDQHLGTTPMHPYNSACIHKRDLYLVLKPQPFFLSILWLTLCLCHRCTQQHTCPPRKPMHTACHPSRHTLSICSNCTSPAVCSLGTHSKLTAGLLPLTPPCLPRSAGPPWRAASAWPVQPRGTLGHSLPERCLVSICNAVRICLQLLSLEGVPMAPPSCHHRQGCTCVTACASGMHASSAGCLLLPSALHAVLLGISNNRSTFSFDGFCFWCQIYELCLTPGY